MLKVDSAAIQTGCLALYGSIFRTDCDGISRNYLLSPPALNNNYDNVQTTFYMITLWRFICSFVLVFNFKLFPALPQQQNNYPPALIPN